MRINAFFLILTLVVIVLSQGSSKGKNPANFIEEKAENYTLNVERKDGSVEIKVYIKDEKLYQTTITTKNFREKVGTNLANLAHLFEIFKTK